MLPVVAHALLRAVSALMPRPGAGRSADAARHNEAHQSFPCNGTFSRILCCAMRYLIAFFAVTSMIGGLGAVAQEKKPPAKLVFTAKTGNVNYDHAAHVKREKSECKVCHDKPWLQ